MERKRIMGKRGGNVQNEGGNVYKNLEMTRTMK